MGIEDEQAHGAPPARADGVSEGRADQTAFLESEQLVRSAFDDAAVGMLIVSGAGQLLRVNDAFAAMLGYTTKELTGRLVQEITHPDDVIRTDDERAEMVADGGVMRRTIVKRYLHKDGSVRWGKVSVSPVGDAANQRLYFVSQIEDITELRETQAGLEESERRFRGAFDDAAVGMLLTDPDGVLLRVNAAFAAMLGYEGAEALEGRNVVEVTHPDDRYGCSLMSRPSRRAREISIGGCWRGATFAGTGAWFGAMSAFRSSATTADTSSISPLKSRTSRSYAGRRPSSSRVSIASAAPSSRPPPA